MTDAPLTATRSPTDEEKIEIVRLFNGDDDGNGALTAGQIALRLGLTRNQVIGIVTRARQKDPTSVVRFGKEAAPLGLRRPPPPPRAPKPPKPPAVIKKAPPPRPPPPESVEFIGADEIPDHGQCKGIKGDPAYRTHQYCAQPTTTRPDGTPSAYCPFHEDHYHEPSRPWRRSARDVYLRSSAGTPKHDLD